MHSSYDDSSRRRDENGTKDGSPLLGHPCWMFCSTLDSFLSFFVKTLMSAADAGESGRCSASNTSSGSDFVVVGSPGSGRRLRASALACAVVFQKVSVYS